MSKLGATVITSLSQIFFLGNMLFKKQWKKRDDIQTPETH